MPSIRRLILADVVTDPALVRHLIAEGETLFVERKRALPSDGLAPTVASFANTLGGWVLLGVTNDRQVVGYEWKGRSDLQDHVREHLRDAVDPLPPFAAASVKIDGKPVGVVRVAESADTPHIVAGTGALYVRLPGGKEPVTDHRTLLEMARRGEEAIARAQGELYGLPLVEAELARMDRLPGQVPVGVLDPPRVLEWVIRARPLTVPGHFADRALTEKTGRAGAKRIAALLPPASPQRGAGCSARARGVCASALDTDPPAQADLVIDAGGVVAARFASYRRVGVSYHDSMAQLLEPQLHVVAETLGDLDAFGRAVVGLELRQAGDLTVGTAGQSVGQLDPRTLQDGALRMGGEIVVPAEADDVRDVVARWLRELFRAAGLAEFEPS
jgi:Putative DNA-binding domain